MQRLLRKFETAKTLVPAPVAHPAKQPTRVRRALFRLDRRRRCTRRSPRSRRRASTSTVCGCGAFPSAQEVLDFIAAHEQVFVVEQNRDAQLRTLLLAEAGLDPAKLASVLHYDGTPITARFISRAIAERLRALNVTPLRKTV